MTRTRTPAPSSRVTITFSGLMSRCTTPRACEYSRASATWMPTSRMSPSFASSWRRKARRFVPWTRGITKNSDPSWWPKSWIDTMAGWSICATTWASRWKRCSASGLSWWGGTHLTATSRLRRGSWAR